MSPIQDDPRGEAVWSVAAILQWTREYFAKHHLDSPRLDAEVLLAHALGQDRIYLYTHFDQPLSRRERDTYRSMVRRRAQHEPVAYIIGEREFFCRRFEVNCDVLIPRPETEHLVEAVLSYVRTAVAPGSPWRILDVGCGSGALAVTLAAEIVEARVTASDISAAALQVTSRNATALGVAERVQCIHSDLLQQVQGSFDIIVSNPPYVSTSDRLPPDVGQYEPPQALFAGADGLSVLRRLCAEAPKHLACPGLFACEIGDTQAEAVRALVQAAGRWSSVAFLPDLQSHLRVLCAYRQEKTDDPGIEHPLHRHVDP